MTTTEFLALAAIEAMGRYIGADKERLMPQAFAVDAWRAAEGLLEVAPEAVRNTLQREALYAAERLDPYSRSR